MLKINHVTEDSVALSIIQMLFTEYADELGEDLCFQHFDEELQDPAKKYKLPTGALLLAYWHDEPAGCIALLPRQDDVCEMKRLYVRPKFRKLGIGDKLVTAVIEEAGKKGFKKMVLDTLQRLQPAIRMYHRYGFKNISAYYQNPLPDVVYMEKTL